MPANTGAEADVPPMIDWLLSTALAIPVAQLLPVPPRPSSDNCVQKM